MSKQEDNPQNNDQNVCIWKPFMKKTVSGKTQLLKFPCRFPEKEKNSELCTPCLLGDMFAMQYTQVQGQKKQSGMNDEMMMYLRNLTSDGSLDDLE